MRKHCLRKLWEDCMENSYKTPFSNRGVVNTLNSEFLPFLPDKTSNIVDEKIKMCIDWCQFTIFGYELEQVFDIFNVLFNLKSSDLYFEYKSLFGYDCCYSYKDICMFYSKSRLDMGFHFLLTGLACREVEDLGINFIDFFKKVTSFNAHFTRLDVAIDNFTNDYFTISKVKKSIKKNCVVSRFKNTTEFIKTNIDSGLNEGYTIWFGSRASKIQVVFYDKLKERESQNYVVDNNIKIWTRLEIRFRDEYSSQVVLNLITNDFHTYIKSILNNYIKFIDFNSTDSNRSRCHLIKWWSDFINDVSKTKLYNNNYVSSLARKKAWLDSSVSRTNAMVLLSNISDLSLDKFSCDYLVDYFTRGFIKINDKDLQFINEYRLKNGLNPLVLEDFKYLIGNIKDVLIERKIL